MAKKQFDKRSEALWVITLLWVVVGGVACAFAPGPVTASIGVFGAWAWGIAIVLFNKYGDRKGLTKRED